MYKDSEAPRVAEESAVLQGPIHGRQRHGQVPEVLVECNKWPVWHFSDMEGPIVLAPCAVGEFLALMSVEPPVNL